MSYSYDLTTTTGQIRLLIPDRIEAEAMFSDEELGAFFLLEGGDVRRATAQALETIASDQAMVLKVMKLLDIQTDGAKLAAELRARASGLRSQAESSDADDPGFDWAEMVLDQFSARERLVKGWQRGI